MIEGRVLDVLEETAGTELAAAATAGAMTLEVLDVLGLDLDGGTLEIAGTTYPYTVPDEDGTEVTLGSPLEADAAEADEVNVYPPALERTALVLELESEQDLEVRVPHALYDRLALGQREDDDTAEVVLVDQDDDEYSVSDVLYEAPVVDGAYIDPETLPPVPASDGTPPAESPTPSVAGGPGYLYAEWAAVANADLVLYELHLSTTTGFIPDASTRAGETSGTSSVIATLGDGTPLERGETYFVRIVAKDADGAAPAGGEGSGSPIAIPIVDLEPIDFADLEGYIGLDQIEANSLTAEQIAANAITAIELAAEAVHAEHVLARELTAEHIAVGSLTGNEIAAGTITGNEIAAQVLLASNIRTGPEGTQRIEMDPAGFRLYGQGPSNPVLVDLPTDPAQMPYFAGTVVAENIDVVNSLVVRGEQQIDKGGRLTLKTGVADPSTPPQLAHRWDELAIALGADRTHVAFDYSTYGSDGPAFVVVEWSDLDGTFYLTRYNAATGALISSVDLGKGSEVECRGIVQFGVDVVIGWREGRNPRLERSSAGSPATATSTYSLPFIPDAQRGAFALGHGNGKVLVMYREAAEMRLQPRNADGSNDGSAS